MVATEMVMVGVGMTVRGTRRAMSRSFNMQKTYGDIVRGGKPCFFNLMGNRKDCIDGKANQHRNQN